MTLRVLLADDHALVRAGLRSLLETIAGMQVVGEAANGTEALRLIGQLHPDVALMDISMPGLNGLEAVRRASHSWRGTRVLMLSVHADEEYVYQALTVGAAGYLLKNSERDELEMALRAVGRGDVWISPSVSRVIPTLMRKLASAEPAKSAVEKLTSRQREVLQLIAEGCTTKEIAQRLRLGVKTIETHRANLMHRLQIHDVAGLVRYAIRFGVIELES